jgi:hypothetical protein
MEENKKDEAVKILVNTLTDISKYTGVHSELGGIGMAIIAKNALADYYRAIEPKREYDVVQVQRTNTVYLLQNNYGVELGSLYETDYRRMADVIIENGVVTKAIHNFNFGGYDGE